MKTISVIYKITNLINKKIYIGSTINYERHKQKHLWKLRHGLHENSVLQNDFNTFGESNFLFEIVQYCDKENILETEEYFISKTNSNNIDIGYNKNVPTDINWRNISEEEYIIAQKNRKRVKNMKDGIVYESIKSASRISGTPRLVIQNSLKRGKPTNDNYWIYV